LRIIELKQVLTGGNFGHTYSDFRIVKESIFKIRY